jgi:hypothetical protein
MPNQANLGSAGPTSLVDRSGVGTISISTLPTCQGGSVHGVSDAQSWWRPSWVAGRPRVRSAGQGLLSYHLKSMVELTHSTYKYPHSPFGAPKFVICRVEREGGEVLRAGELPSLLGVLRVARAWMLCQNLFGFDGVVRPLVWSSAGPLPNFYEFQQRTDSRVPLVYWSPGLSGLSYDITLEWVICQS